MPFALVILGLVMIVSGAKDTYRELGAELVQDFTGPGNFTWWLAGMGAVGAVGYYEPLRPASRLFLVLIIVSMLLSNQGFFSKLTGALQSGPVSPTPPETTEAKSGGAGVNPPPELDLTFTGRSRVQPPRDLGELVALVGNLTRIFAGL